MGAYRKKPVVVQAFRLGKDPTPDWFLDYVSCHDFQVWVNGQGYFDHCQFTTPEGVMTADYGDDILLGVNGAPSPCKAEIFAETYLDELGDAYDG